MLFNLFTPSYPVVDVNIPEGWWKSDSQLDIDFANNRAFNRKTAYKGRPTDLLTYTSPSPKMIYGADGVLYQSSGTLPIDHDPITHAPLGVLIEEQRTNLLTYSEQFDNAAWLKSNITITANAATAPDGTTTADKIEATTSAAITARQSSVVASTAATFSIYVKIGSGATAANKFALYNITTASDLLGISFNYSTGAITYNVGSTGASAIELSDGWWRIILSASSGITSGNTIQVYPCFSGSSETAGEYAYIWGAQLEAGAFATSYIPTVASQVTRAADQVSILTSAFAYNAAEGSLVSEADTGQMSAVVYSYIASLGDGGGTERVVARSLDATASFAVVDGGVAQVASNISGTVALNVPFKLALAYKVNDFAATKDGGTVATDASGTLPTVTTLKLGADGGASASLNGHIKRLTYFPTRKTNAELQGLTI